MIIEKVYIKSFGKLNNLNATLGSGVNIVNGKNEAGKSTFCSFIKFILYGALGPKEDKYKYISWDTGRAAGYLEIITDDKKRFRIERDAHLVYSKDGKATLSQTSQVIDLQTGRQIMQNKVPGEELLGVNLEIFENTIFIKQIGDNKVEGKTLATSAENIIFSADEDINIDTALRELDKIRVELVHKKGNGGKIQELSNRKESLEQDLFENESKSADIIRLRNKVAKDEMGIEKSTKVFLAAEKKREDVINYNLKKNMEKRQKLYYELKDLQDGLDELKSCKNHAGIKIYEQEYIDDLKSSIVEIEKIKKDRDNAERKRDEKNEKYYNIQDKAKKIEKLGVTEEEINKMRNIVDSIHSKVKNNKLAYLILLIIGLIFVSLGVVMFVIDQFSPIISYILLGVGIVLVILSFVFLMKYVKNNKNLKKILNKNDMSSYDEYLNVMSFVLKDTEQILEIRKEKEDADKVFKEYHDKYTTVVERVVEFLNKNCFTITSDAEIISSIQAAITECELLKGKIEAQEERIQEKNNSIEIIDEQLRQYSDEYLKNVLSMTFDEEEYGKYNLDEVNKQYTFYTQQLERQKASLNDTKIELARLEAINPDPTVVAEELDYTKQQLEYLKEKYLAIELAMDAITSARGKLRNGLSPKIAESASNYISVLSNGKYSKISVSNDFDVTYEDDGTTHHISALSAGTTDIAYLAMRFALIENLYKQNKPPFIFDESFSRLDPQRLKNVLTLLADLTNNGLQCLIFTCHGREEAILKQYTQYIVHNIQ